VTSVIMAIVGILIAAACTVAGFVYYDMDSGSAVEGSVTVSQGVMALDETAASFRDSTGATPSTLDDLKSIGDLPTLPRLPGAAWAVAPGLVCLYADRGAVADRSLRDAAARLGPKAAVSGTCGDSAPPGRSLVLSYPVAS
jgi:hypothetical protein